MCIHFIDYVFNDETETAIIYERLVKPMVASSLEGYNGMIMLHMYVCMSTLCGCVRVFAGP